MALNRDPHDLCLLSSWDYRCELLVLADPQYLFLEGILFNPCESLGEYITSNYDQCSGEKYGSSPRQPNYVSKYQ
jgi:hypothetical protein